MTTEVVVLRAYALASQGKYAEAEQLLASVPEALNTPSGADLLARIKFECGDEESARQIWERILASDPANESARSALAAMDKPAFADEDNLIPIRRKWLYAGIATLAMLLGVSFSIGKACHVESPESGAKVVAEQTLKISRINSKTLAELRDGILTNVTDKTILVLSGGRGKYVTDRQRSLSVVADCIKEHARIPFAQMYLNPSDVSSDVIRLTLMKGVCLPCLNIAGNDKKRNNDDN